MDSVWGEDKPAKPHEQVNALGLEFAGLKVEQKLENLRKELEKKKCVGFIVCESSEGWLGDHELS